VNDETFVQEDVNKIVSAISQSSLTLNSSKTQTILFSYNKLTLSVSGHFRNVVSSALFLSDRKVSQLITPVNID